MFLAVTGAETLYADMGHFGRRAIGLSWLTLVYPCLTLNYWARARCCSAHPAAAANPFYLMAPEWARLPLVLIATAATIIASQAVISGAFSVTHQAVQLGFLPRLQDRAYEREGGRADLHPGGQLGPAGDGHHAGARLPRIRPARVGLWHRGHRHDADHHGDARRPGVPGVALEPGAGDRDDRPVPRSSTAPIFASNITKIPDGGWFPLLVAAVSFTVLTTWAKGRQLMRERLEEVGASARRVHQVGGASVHRVRGTSVFLSTSADIVPAALLHNLKHNQVLHERVLILNVKVEEVPHVAPREARRNPRRRRRASTA